MSSPLTPRAMVEGFEAGCTAVEDLAVGLEWEKDPVTADGHRLGFFGAGGVRDTLDALADRYGWQRDVQDGNTIGLARAGASITLEPGGQIEYATPPRKRVSDVIDEVHAHLDELHSVLRPDVRLLQTAYTPIQPVQDIAFVPKARYAVMGPYMATRGALAHGMMKGTTSIQVALDFQSEDDCRTKFHAAMAISPLVTALCANSPLAGGIDTGVASYRARCWQQTDPDRTGLLDDLLSSPFSFERYVQWLMDVPLMFVWLDGAYRPGGGRTFRDWHSHGIDGVFPDRAAWEAHQTSVFPEVRVKNFIEVRGADNGSLAQIAAIALLWTGLLYDERALAATAQLGEELARHRDALLEAATEDGLAGRAAGRTLAEWTGELVELAAAGMQRRGEDASGLDWARDRVARASSPSDDVRKLRRELDDAALVQALSYRAD